MTDDAHQLWDRAQAAYASQDWRGAADLFAELILSPDIDPHAATHELHWNLGVCYAHMGNVELARQHFEAGGYSESDFQHMLGQQATDQAHELWDQAQAAFSAEQWEHAADLFAELVLSPGIEAHVAAHELQWNLGVCYAHMGNNDLARQHFQAGGYTEADFQHLLGNLASDQAHHLWDQAQAAFHAQQWEQAADFFADLILSPGVDAHASVHELQWNLGMCYAHMGNMDLARQHFEAGGYSQHEYQPALDEIAGTTASN